jgi:hypothetical protein
MICLENIFKENDNKYVIILGKIGLAIFFNTRQLI